MELSTHKYKIVNNFISTCEQILFPSICILCGVLTKNKFSVCSACLNDLSYVQTACKVCGISLNSSVENRQICGQCLQKPPPYEQTCAVFNYQYPIDKLITKLKFASNLVFSKVLGQLMAQKILPQLNPCDIPDCIIPIPLHRKRLIERGFNQALELARPIAKISNIPLDFTSCSRRQDTQAQSLIPAEKRAKNLKNAFEIIKTMSYRHIAIIDDVVTTGSTVNEFANLLKKQGIEKIQVWCCARTNLSNKK